jgi:hypothetical protein
MGWWSREPAQADRHKRAAADDRCPGPRYGNAWTRRRSGPVIPGPESASYCCYRDAPSRLRAPLIVREFFNREDSSFAVVRTLRGCFLRTADSCFRKAAALHALVLVVGQNELQTGLSPRGKVTSDARLAPALCPHARNIRTGFTSTNRYSEKRAPRKTRPSESPQPARAKAAEPQQCALPVERDLDAPERSGTGGSEISLPVIKSLLHLRASSCQRPSHDQK